MKLKRYKVIYHPFPNSDVTAEAFVNGINEADALAEFRLNPANYGKSVKEITEV